MQYLFYDLEYASQYGGKTKICEFGYVISDEKFNIIERDNLIINPDIEKDAWDYRALRTILTRTKKEYENGSIFYTYYDRIRNLILNADYVLGHSLDGDAKAINDECERYGLESIDYYFYDTKEIYK